MTKATSLRILALEARFEREKKAQKQRAATAKVAAFIARIEALTGRKTPSYFLENRNPNLGNKPGSREYTYTGDGRFDAAVEDPRELSRLALDSVNPASDADVRPYPKSRKECVRLLIQDIIRTAKSQIEKLADHSLAADPQRNTPPKSQAIAELPSIESSPAPAQKEFGFQAASQREAEDRHRENLLARQLVIAEREKEEDLRRTRAWLARQPRPFMGGFL